MQRKSREQIESFEIKHLAFYATKSAYSKGRKIKISEHPFRTAFQRDIDRIIHSKAFRRLECKTQVYVYYEGDHYRTRLTHTLEVVQLSSTVSRVLDLNEDLTCAIALAHDLGHTPFGHSGESELNKIMQEEINEEFRHNIQGVKIVDELEKKYETYNGLNLTWEVREGILKHTSIDKNKKYVDLEIDKPSTLEGQVVAICDEIAQNSHDLDDGLREKIISLEDIRNLGLYKSINIKEKQNDFEIIINLIDFLITDLIDNTLVNLEKGRNPNVIQVCFSNEVKTKEEELREFLTEKIYNSYRVKRMDNKARNCIRSLYETYKKDPLQLPDEVLLKYCESKKITSLRKLSKEKLEELKKDSTFLTSICDYIAGMTDRYAHQEYRRLFMPDELV